MMEILEIIKSRHSVRQYRNQTIEESKREELNTCIKEANEESHLSIQVFMMNRSALIPLWLITESSQM